ncbi:hypothetical protein ACOSP7_030886 [Xanthoceras sorbifolium]
MVTHTCLKAGSDVWYIDSGCTNHIARDLSIFTNMDSNDRTSIKLGNEEVVKFTSRGTIFIFTPNGVKLINNVLLVSELDQNLLSVAQLIRNGYSILFKDGGCNIIDENENEVVKVPMRENSFPLNWNHLNQKALVTRHESYATWHKRYGHFNSNALKYLQANEMVRDMPKVECIDNGVC